VVKSRDDTGRRLRELGAAIEGDLARAEDVQSAKAALGMTRLVIDDYLAYTWRMQSASAPRLGTMTWKRRWLPVTILVAAVLAALLAWSASRPHSTTSGATTPVAVQGRVVSVGGGYLGGALPVRSAPLLVSGQTTTGTAVHRKLFFADQNGRFTVKLPPGVYTITAPLNYSQGTGQPRQPHVTFTVKPGAPLHVQITQQQK
jgi:hypothetical protein